MKALHKRDLCHKKKEKGRLVRSIRDTEQERRTKHCTDGYRKNQGNVVLCT